MGTGDAGKKNFPYFDIVDRVLGDRDVISNKHVVDLGATAVRDVEKPKRRVLHFWKFSLSTQCSKEKKLIYKKAEFCKIRYLFNIFFNPCRSTFHRL